MPPGSRVIGRLALPLVGGLALAVVGLSGYLWLQSGWLEYARAERDSLQRELRVAREIAEHEKLARKVDEARRDLERERAAELQRATETLLTGDFQNADTPIDPRITDFLGCMLRVGDGDEGRCAAALKRPADAGLAE